jgi:hypothetical protein
MCGIGGLTTVCAASREAAGFAAVCVTGRGICIAGRRQKRKYPPRWAHPGNPDLNGRMVDPQLRNWGPISMVLLYLLAAYVTVGIAVAVAFVTVGVAQVQPMPVTVGARILLLPGAFVLWPLVVARWHKSRGGR